MRRRVDDRERVVVMVRDSERVAMLRCSNRRCVGAHLEAETAEAVLVAMPERHACRALFPLARAVRELVDAIVRAAAHVEAVALWMKGQADDGVRLSDDLRLSRRASGYVTNDGGLV